MRVIILRRLSSSPIYICVTKEILTEEVRHDLLNVFEIGKKKYEAFHSKRIINKSLNLSETIQRNNFKTMISISNKPKTTAKKVIREISMTEKSTETAQGRGGERRSP